MKATQKYKNITNKANLKEIKQRRRHIITAKQASKTNLRKRKIHKNGNHYRRQSSQALKLKYDPDEQWATTKKYQSQS